MTDARLVPVPPTPGIEVILTDLARCVIGSDPSAHVAIDEPGVRGQHCVLEYHASRWVLVDADPTVLVNGRQLSSATRLFDRDVIAVSATLSWEFVSGELRTAELSMPLPVHRRKRRRRAEGFDTSRPKHRWSVFGFVMGSMFLVALAGVAVWYVRQPGSSTAGVLSDAQAIRFDSLLTTAYDHLERGNSLLELGIQGEAALEFARGINTLALSDLRNHPQVKPRILALESSVAAIYRARQLAVPEAYASVRSALSAEKIRAAVLSRDQFAHAFDLVSGAFQLRFGSAIVVVGRDHAEHLSLYGPGGALDLRTMGLTAEQVAFVIAQCHSYGIRVKDFSQDSILQRQVRAAVSAGLGERAGTGLHLHIDRFAARHDRWTIGARGGRASDQQKLQPRDAGERELRPVFEPSRFATLDQFIVDIRAVQAGVDQVVGPVFAQNRTVVTRHIGVSIAQHQLVLLFRSLGFR